MVSRIIGVVSNTIARSIKKMDRNEQIVTGADEHARSWTEQETIPGF